MNFTKRDRVVMLICAIVALMSIYFLNDPRIFLGNFNSKFDSIGRIVMLEKDVRTKNLGTYFWNEAEPNGNISPGLSLFTGEKSTSTIEFSDGKKIKISENSLVKFSVSNNEILLDFSFGEISAQGLSKTIKVVICDKTYEISPDKASAFALKKTNECGRLNVKVQKGEIKLNNKKVTVEKEFVQPAKTDLKTLPIETVQTPPPPPPVEPNPTPIVETPPPPPTVVKLDAPELLNKSIKHRIVSKVAPKIEWSKVSEASKYQLETSFERTFKKPSVIDTKDLAYTLPENPSRKMYFRTRALSDKGDPGYYSEIGEIEPTFPKIKLENKDQSFLYQAKNSKDNGGPKKFDIAWSPVPGSQQYEVEVSRTTSFDKVAKIKTREPASALNLPSAGKYHWRVSALSAQGKVLSQSEDYGTVDYAKVFDLKQPEVPERYKDASFFFQKTAARFIWISWNPVNVAEPVYKIELSTTPNFSNIIKTYENAKTTMLIRDQIPEGIYFWRVRAEVGSQVSDWSETATFKILTGSKRNTAGEDQK